MVHTSGDRARLTLATRLVSSDRERFGGALGAWAGNPATWRRDHGGRQTLDEGPATPVDDVDGVAEFARPQTRVGGDRRRPAGRLRGRGDVPAAQWTGGDEPVQRLDDPDHPDADRSVASARAGLAP